MKTYFFSFLVLVTLCMSACSKDEATTPPDNGGGMTTDTTFVAQVTGTFLAQNGYQAEGTVQLGADDITPAIIKLDANFKASLQTGAVTLYLSKNQQLKLSEAASVQRIALITKQGAQQFALAAKPTSDFKYAILWCASAGVQFGNAELK
jgi:glycine betaine/choline ABC-type transport system substrate-binding protein